MLEDNIEELILNVSWFCFEGVLESNTEELILNVSVFAVSVWLRAIYKN